MVTLAIVLIRESKNKLINYENINISAGIVSIKRVSFNITKVNIKKNDEAFISKVTNIFLKIYIFSRKRRLLLTYLLLYNGTAVVIKVN